MLKEKHIQTWIAILSLTVGVSVYAATMNTKIEEHCKSSQYKEDMFLKRLDKMDEKLDILIGWNKR